LNALTFVTRVTRPVSLVEQKLPPIAEQLSSTQPLILWGSCRSIFQFSI